MQETISMTAQERQEFEAFKAKKQEREARERRKADRETFKKLSEEFVNANINYLAMHQQATEKVINDLFKEYKHILELKGEVYGNRVDTQDSHTSTLEDGSASITIGYNVSIGFDGTESEGVKKIRNFINSLTDTQDNDKVKKLSKMVNTFLKPNAKTGMLNPVKIIELSKLREEFGSEDFNDGIDIIFNAQVRSRNSMYVSGWKYITEDDVPKKLEFRFTV